jgi:hypothetical protein
MALQHGAQTRGRLVIAMLEYNQTHDAGKSLSPAIARVNCTRQLPRTAIGARA